MVDKTPLVSHLSMTTSYEVEGGAGTLKVIHHLPQLTSRPFEEEKRKNDSEGKRGREENSTEREVSGKRSALNWNSLKKGKRCSSYRFFKCW